MPYAAHDLERRAPEPPKDEGLGRTPFQRDRARVLHSAALRRLAAKTQVVGVGESDFPRTRLTHSLECAQIGREMGEALGADPDVVDAACLAHDLGHPPFGHNGETALAAVAERCGGFEGNAQSFRVLTRLEAKIEGAGLNLTRSALDAATKYPWGRDRDPRKYGVYADDAAAFEWVRAGAGEGSCFEAQVMDWADDVAYSVHDLEDGVHAMHVPLDRLDLDAVAEVAARDYGCPRDAAPLRDLMRRAQWLERYDATARTQAGLKRMTSWLTGRLSAAAVHATRAAQGEGSLVRYGGRFVVPQQAQAECALLKAVAAHYVMTRRVQLQERQRELLLELVAAVERRAPDSLEPWLREQWPAALDDAARMRLVIDQVASLTDTSAVEWHSRLVAQR